VKLLELARWAYTPHGTFGTLTIKGAAAGPWWTVERHWLGNQPGVSCIPAGTYRVKPDMFYQDKRRGPYPDYTLLEVPGRANIDVHIANHWEQLKGCIGLGKRLGAVTMEGGGQRWAVLDSAAAFGEFMAAMGGEDGVLVVRSWPDVAGTWPLPPPSGAPLDPEV
jgi:hypothetical protein